MVPNSSADVTRTMYGFFRGIDVEEQSSSLTKLIKGLRSTSSLTKVIKGLRSTFPAISSQLILLKGTSAVQQY